MPKIKTKASGERGSTLRGKADSVFEKNEGLQKLCDINRVLLGGNATSVVPDDPVVLSAFMYAPITSVDIERSFSDLKTVLTDRRHSFKEDSLESHLIVLHNTRALKID